MRPWSLVSVAILVLTIVALTAFRIGTRVTRPAQRIPRIPRSSRSRSSLSPTGVATFSTGFGANGNDKTSPNIMGNIGVSRKAADLFMATAANLTVSPCPFGDLIRVGAVGAIRFLCGLSRLQKLDATLFSFGSNGDFRFEDEVRKHSPHINVTVFDPTVSKEAMASRSSVALSTALAHAKQNHYEFVGTGIAYQKGLLEMKTIRGRRLFCGPVDTLPALLDASPYSTIGVLKVDASGEFEIFSKLLEQGLSLKSKVGVICLPLVDCSACDLAAHPFSCGPAGSWVVTVHGTDLQVGILLLEIHMYHPQADGGTANCCYGPRDFDDLFAHLRSQGFILVGTEMGDCCAEYSFVNPTFPGFSTPRTSALTV